MGAHRGHVMRAKAPQKNKQKESQSKKQTERQRENRQQTQTYPQKHKNAIHNLLQQKTKTSKNNTDKTQNIKEMQLSVPDTRKRKNAYAKTRANSKMTQPKAKQENTQQKQKH